MTTISKEEFDKLLKDYDADFSKREWYRWDLKSYKSNIKSDVGYSQSVIGILIKDRIEAMKLYYPEATL